VRVSFSDAPPVGESGGEDEMVGVLLVGLLRRFLLAADLALEDDDDDDDAAATVVVEDTERSNRSKEDLNSMKWKMERKRKEFQGMISEIVT
jgi:hypothetical protein